ncbi:MAG: sigma 54-interacting transcriptional regulator [Prevotellaceae bacterium]|jgi:transcriptional regulator with PAS, ATPase and Fis domain|nr:sigma 54-interacting transcriptional regulator [Prevotellaceae bacterium]
MDIQQIKLRFGIIGSAPGLLRALDVAVQVAPTDMSVLITGESGVGKEVFPQVIHQNSARKHGAYFAVNCGAIPEGTVDSELFGHEKGSFTGAYDARKGYFEVANGGTLFLDEVAELPLFTQVRLLRVLETGEFLRVGSAKPQKTNVRVIAATNVNLPQAIQNGKFREDLYYRLNTVPIIVPPLRDRKEDIALLFRKFAADFAEKYKMPPVQLAPEARATLESYPWPGNIRQLKNITEQISVIESERQISAETLRLYLPEASLLPVIYKNEKAAAGGGAAADFSSEREILYKFLFDVKNDVNELKKLVNALMQGEARVVGVPAAGVSYADVALASPAASITIPHSVKKAPDSSAEQVLDASEVVDDESLLINEKELELIRKALEKHHGKRKAAAQELGISERTLYRKIKDYGLG